MSGDAQAVTAVRQLSAAGRAPRVVVTVLVFGLLLGTTLWGFDKDFPFSPFRMYASKSKLDGRVHWLTLEAKDSTGWHWQSLSPSNVGINRAELEGTFPKVRADPAMLKGLATAHARLHPGDPKWTSLRVKQRTQALRDGKPVGPITEHYLVRYGPS